MLTKTDLLQIRGVVKEEIQIEVSPMKKDVRELKNYTETLGKDISKIRGDIDTIINFFDREYLGLRKRVENIEHHLGITYSS